MICLSLIHTNKGTASGFGSTQIIIILALLGVIFAFSVPNKTDGGGVSTLHRDGARSVSKLQIGAYLGGSDTRGEQLMIDGLQDGSLTIEKLQWVGQSLKAPVYYGIRTTKWLSTAKLIGLMADFTHIKAIANPDQTVHFDESTKTMTAKKEVVLGEHFKRLQFSHGLNLLTVNGVFALPLFSGWLKPYIGIGTGVAVPHVEVQHIGDTSEQWTNEYQITGPAWQALIGVEIRLAERISFFLEYKVNYANIDVTLDKGERLRTRLLTHQGLSGLMATISQPGPPVY
jgi:opacity protein-like surface antigen